jgi:DNA-directed RNA polymerase specialized sigma24 family protein
MDSNLENKLLMDALALAIKGQLTANQRHAIFLRFAVGLSLLETARIVGKAAGSVKMTQSRAIAILRKVLGLR